MEAVDVVERLEFIFAECASKGIAEKRALIEACGQCRMIRSFWGAEGDDRDDAIELALATLADGNNNGPVDWNSFLRLHVRHACAGSMAAAAPAPIPPEDSIALEEHRPFGGQRQASTEIEDMPTPTPSTGRLSAEAVSSESSVWPEARWHQAPMLAAAAPQTPGKLPDAAPHEDRPVPVVVCKAEGRSRSASKESTMAGSVVDQRTPVASGSGASIATERTPVPSSAQCTPPAPSSTLMKVASGVGAGARTMLRTPVVSSSGGGARIVTTCSSTAAPLAAGVKTIVPTPCIQVDAPKAEDGDSDSDSTASPEASPRSWPRITQWQPKVDWQSHAETARSLAETMRTFATGAVELVEDVVVASEEFFKERPLAVQPPKRATQEDARSKGEQVVRKDRPTQPTVPRSPQAPVGAMPATTSPMLAPMSAPASWGAQLPNQQAQCQQAWQMQQMQQLQQAQQHLWQSQQACYQQPFYQSQPCQLPLLQPSPYKPWPGTAPQQPFQPQCTQSIQQQLPFRAPMVDAPVLLGSSPTYTGRLR